jgi:hypothetical protein
MGSGCQIGGAAETAVNTAFGIFAYGSQSLQPRLNSVFVD